MTPNTLTAAEPKTTLDDLYALRVTETAAVYLSWYERAAAEALAAPCMTNSQWSQRYWTLYQKALAAERLAA